MTNLAILGLARLNTNKIEYIGSVTKGVTNTLLLDSEAEALTGLVDLTEVGDLVVITISGGKATNLDTPWSWAGIPFTALLDEPTYVGYHFMTGTETDPYIVDGPYLKGVAVVASVFRGITNLGGSASHEGSSGKPNPPSLTSNSKLWIITGSLTYDFIIYGAPANYTTAAQKQGTDGTLRATTVIGYRIESLSSDDPGVFGGIGDDDNWATTSAFY